MSFLLMVLSFSVIEIDVFALNSGECGENVMWEYNDSTKTLTISGKGDIKDYDAFQSFGDNYNNIKTIVITDGVTSIGNYFFGICDSVTSIYVPVSITKINKQAFENCSSLRNVYYEGTKLQWEKIEISTDGNNYLLNAKINYKEDYHTCSFGEWKIVNEPTCIADGSKIRKCSCGNTESSTVPATGIHSFSEWQTTTNETDGNKIEEIRTCIFCKMTETRVIDNIQAPDGENILAGDANNDGEVTALDARLILQVVAGLKEVDDLNFLNSDINNDNSITALDARNILQIVAGLK